MVMEQLLPMRLTLGAATSEGQVEESVMRSGSVARSGCMPAWRPCVMWTRGVGEREVVAAPPRRPHCTVYGTGKASPRDFLSHHTAALSSALVAADANNVLAAAAALDRRLVSGRHGE